VEKDKIVVYGAGFVIQGISEGGLGSFAYILIGVIVLLVIGNVSWFVILRKRFRNE
jgi:membrane protein DedA with SNARE-associated domain